MVVTVADVCDIMRCTCFRAKTGVLPAEAPAKDEEDEEEAKSDEYSEEMQKRMGGYLVYRHEDGINWNDIADQLVVGSCLQTPDDVDRFVP